MDIRKNRSSADEKEKEQKNIGVFIIDDLGINFDAISDGKRTGSFRGAISKRTDGAFACRFNRAERGAVPICVAFRYATANGFFFDGRRGTGWFVCLCECFFICDTGGRGTMKSGSDPAGSGNVT